MHGHLALTITAAKWPYLPALERLALALALGLFIGMERERRGKDAGLRTFALICLLGALGGILGLPYALAALGLVAVLVILTNLSALVGTRQRDMELTTSVAMCVVAFIGVLCGLGHTLTPAAVGIVVAALLAWKEHMVPFTLRLTEEEIRSAILLGIIAVVIYPALPTGTVDRWDLVNIRSAWVTVILIAGIGFINYILLKRFGSKGIELTGFLGGLVSTTVTTAELARREKESHGSLAEETYRGVLLSRASMVLRNGLIMLLLSARAFLVSLPALICMLIGSTWFLLGRRKSSAGAGDETNETVDLGIRSPFSLQSVLKYGVLFLVLQVTGILAERTFGSLGFFAVTAIGSLVSSASAVSSAAALAAHGSISATAAGIGAVIANLVSSAVDAVLVAQITGERVLSRRLAVGTTIICLLGGVGTAVSIVLLQI